jgi:cysteinyl-tRNA synthetase
MWGWGRILKMKLYNTLTKKIENIEPIDSPNIRFYACGPTVYDYTHIGHLRRYLFDDVLIRVLEHADYKVKHVMNVTDVGHLTSDGDTGEDKLEKGAKKHGQSVWDIAKKFEKIFLDSVRKIGNQKPDVICKATDYIQEQLKLVKDLESKGFTYVINNDGVYFDTSKISDYGQLANLDIKNIREGERVTKVVGKKNATDFALWKFEREGEERQMVWESPWHKRSFPGWHVECSAMAMKNLGEQIDIHSGGIEHKAVHHPNEIAQSESVTGKSPFVKVWVHHNHLLADGQKMSKSLGNFYTIDDVIEKGFSPMALRLLFLSGHYRDEQNFTWQALEGVQKAWERLIRIMNKESRIEDLSEKALDYKKRFFDYLENDLKTPEVVAVMWEVVKDRELDNQIIRKLVGEFGAVLGLDFKSVVGTAYRADPAKAQVPAQVQELLNQRQKAREEKDWPEADRLREEVKNLGFGIRDVKGEQEIFRH